MAQTVKNLPAMQETRIWSLGLEDPLKKRKATHSSILAWRIPWTEEPTGRLQSMGPQRIRHDWATKTFSGKNTAHNVESLQSLGGRLWRSWDERHSSVPRPGSRTHGPHGYPEQDGRMVYEYHMRLSRLLLPRGPRRHSSTPQLWEHPKGSSSCKQTSTPTH